MELSICHSLNNNNNSKSKRFEGCCFAQQYNNKRGGGGFFLFPLLFSFGQRKKGFSITFGRPRQQQCGPYRPKSIGRPLVYHGNFGTSSPRMEPNFTAVSGTLHRVRKSRFGSRPPRDEKKRRSENRSSDTLRNVRI